MDLYLVTVEPDEVLWTHGYVHGTSLKWRCDLGCILLELVNIRWVNCALKIYTWSAEICRLHHLHQHELWKQGTVCWVQQSMLLTPNYDPTISRIQDLSDEARFVQYSTIHFCDPVLIAATDSCSRDGLLYVLRYFCAHHSHRFPVSSIQSGLLLNECFFVFHIILCKHKNNQTSLSGTYNHFFPILILKVNF